MPEPQNKVTKEVVATKQRSPKQAFGRGNWSPLSRRGLILSQRRSRYRKKFSPRFPPFMKRKGLRSLPL